MKFIPFRLKILAFFVLLLGAGLVSSLAIVRHSQTVQVQADIRSRLETTRSLFLSILASRERQLSTAVQLLAGDFAFKQTITETRDAATIRSAAQNFQSRIGSDALWVVGDDGSVLADTTDGLKPGESMKGLPVVAAALDGTPGAAVQPVGRTPYQLSAVPILAPDPIGALAAGFRIDDAFAKRVKAMSLSEVSFAAEGRLFASTLAPDERRVLEAALATLKTGQLTIVGEAPRRQLVLPDDAMGGVTAYVQVGYDEALEPLRRQIQLLTITGLAVFAASLLFGFVIANGVTAPVETLVEATQKLAAGDYGVRVDIRQRDELGQLGSAFNSMVTGLQEKEKIRSVLRKAVSKEIADELLKRGQINLGGEERTVTVLFSDIRSFTTISEGLEPPKLVEQLNAYFKKMSEAIESRHGVIDKFVGDAIMALFGAPLSTPDDAANALRAALAMVDALAALNSERKAKGQAPWANGIGVNTGRVVAGTMGSEERWSYTVIGDAVNLASRLEGLTKHYGAKVLVSLAAKEAAKGAFVLRTLDLVRVKGKHEPVEVFELLGEGIAAPPWLAPFEAAVEAYRGCRFPEAQTAFEQALRLKPGDVAAREYLERLVRLAGAPAPEGWEPAVTMLEK